MSLFANKNSGNLETKYQSSIANLLLVVVFSIINIVLLVTNGNSYFLFSAFIPYFAVDYGMYFCGMYPEEYYYDIPGIEFADKSLLITTIIIAVVVLLVYVLCWFLARKKKIGAVIFSLVFFIIDTLTMFYMTGFSSDSIIDVLIHIWVISYLIIAIITYYKMKKAPEEEIELIAESEETVADENSSPLRMAEDVKHRVLLEADVSGMNIVFRRVKRTNELVINGNVYDEYEALAEFEHTLTTNYNGHKVEAIYDGKTSVKILVDSQEIAKKLRLF